MQQRSSSTLGVALCFDTIAVRIKNKIHTGVFIGWLLKETAIFLLLLNTGSADGNNIPLTKTYFVNPHDDYLLCITSIERYSIKRLLRVCWNDTVIACLSQKIGLQFSILVVSNICANLDPRDQCCRSCTAVGSRKSKILPKLNPYCSVYGRQCIRSSVTAQCLKGLHMQ